ncbi:hypothetical protein [Enterococcus casseliflavus]|uniref:hypothetical protein n=1 Tax=Enterococcus casseliflavus TaxID=37734 RepID=UPI001BCAD327|nr:hypothetical protein [Enterococcus casseliflavus]
MSKKRGKQWFSAQKLVDEMNELSIDELQEFELTFGRNSEVKTETGKSESLPLEEALNTIEEKITKQPNMNAKKDDSSEVTFGEEKQSTKEEQREEKKNLNTNSEADIDVSDKGELMNNNQDKIHDSLEESSKQKVEQDKLIEQLSFEIKELILENEQLQEEKSKLEEKQKETEKQYADFKYIKDELSEAERKINELENKIQDDDIENLQKEIITLKEAVEHERNDYIHKIEELQNKYDLQEKEVVELKAQLSEKEDLLNNQDPQESTAESKELIAKIASLEEENAALQVENEQFQTEISEVLVFARRKANRTIQEAKIESERMIRTTEMRIDAIHDRAKEILFEVNETKESVIGLFDDLHNQVYQLSDKKLLFEELEK